MTVSEIPPGEDGTWFFNEPGDLEDHLRVAMLRTAPRWIDTTPSPGGTYVHLGHGKKLIRGYRHLDYPEWDGNKDKLPFHDGQVDGVIMYHTLDHIDNPMHALSEIARVLRLGGVFTNVVPHYMSELAHSCLEHHHSYAIKTWFNAFSERHYEHGASADFRIGFNMVMGFEERNLVLVTQLIKK